ncbi:MAG: glyoxalase [Amylibacter sp.]
MRAFYLDVFDLDVAMDFGWISTLASGEVAPVQISGASEGGSGTAVPDLSIEVDDVDAVYAQVQALGHSVEYGIVDEPWGVRRFYVRDPVGTLLNVLAHI